MSSLAIFRRKQKRLLTTALERAAALLHRPGLQDLRELLEESLFVLAHPLLAHRISRSRGRYDDEMRAIDQVIAWLDAKLAEQGIEARFDGRVKRISSIHRKMMLREMPLERVHDLRGVRIIVDDEAACYRALALIHESYDPVPNQFDDYIAHPKSNSYQSLHTVVMDSGGRTYEIQIRTPTMHQVAEQGSAAHWRYKVLFKSNGKELSEDLSETIAISGGYSDLGKGTHCI